MCWFHLFDFPGKETHNDPYSTVASSATGPTRGAAGMCLMTGTDASPRRIQEAEAAWNQTGGESPCVSFVNGVCLASP